MLTFPRGLTPAELDAVADLERRVLAVDGGRLKLEWGTLQTRSGEHVEDVLAWDDDGRLVGFLGTYCFDTVCVELAGMVDPAARRRGVGSALLTAAVALCARRGAREVLLVVPRGSEGGHALALGRAAVPHHSEHALVLTVPPGAAAASPRLTLRPAEPADAPGIARLLAAGFGGPTDDLLAAVTPRLASTLVGEHDGVLVASVRVERHDSAAAVYGFVVDPARQGQGFGRHILSLVCQQLFDAGAGSVALEVATHNERALGLYTSLGFAAVAVEDYYALPMSPDRA